MPTTETLTDDQRTRFAEAADVWLSTIRPEGRAHLVPVWAVLVDDALYIGSESKAQKVKNVRAHPSAAISLPDPNNVLIVEGVATLIESDAPPAVLAAFQTKYDWTITLDDGKWTLLRVVPNKVHMWNTEGS